MLILNSQVIQDLKDIGSKMLVLTRKIGQKLIIAENIEVVILEIKGESVKLGIKAPKNISVYREEIFEEIKKANEQATRNVLIADLDLAFNLFENKKIIKPKKPKS